MPFKTPSGNLFYRIGDVIITINEDDPSVWYGGTWELFAPGRTIVCIDENDNDFNTVDKYGGSKYMQSHMHSASSASSGSHTHTGYTGTNGSHTHSMGTALTYKYGANDKNAGSNGGNWTSASNHSYTTGSSGDHSHSITTYSSGDHSHTITISSNGSGNSQNLQPYVVVYMWIRIA